MQGSGPLYEALRAALTENGPLAARVVVSAADDAQLLEQVDQRAWRDGEAWLPIVATGAAVRIGPLIRPHRTPCVRCLRLRHSTTDPDAADYEILSRPSSAASTAAAGYAPHHIAIIAAIATDLMRSDPPPDQRPGPARGAWLGLLSSDVTPFLVYSAHGCPRCAGEVYRRDSSRFASLAIAAAQR